MCQVGVVALGIFLVARESSPEHAEEFLTFFSDANVEFMQPVKPGQTVTIKGQRVFWRRKKLRTKVEMFLEDGALVAQATVAGMGVRKDDG